MAEPLYRIRVVAQRVGLSEAVIRAWERRYRLLEPRRTPGGYRAYTEADIALLLKVKDLTSSGVSIGDAALLLPLLRQEVAQALQAPRPAAAPATDAAPLARWREEMLAAARAFDQARVEEVLEEAFAALPPLVAWERLVVPVLVQVGEQWAAGELSVAEEHLVTQAVRTRLLSVLGAHRARAGRRVVCACLPDEEHELGLLGAALRFKEAGLTVTYLGQRTPDDLGRSVGRARPQLVALAAHIDLGARAFRTSLGRVLKALPRGLLVVVGGAAARAHASVVAELGAEVVDSQADWDRLLARLPP